MLKKTDFKNQVKSLVDSPENYTYLLAVSGGVDSMVLAELFRKCNYSFEVAHINYKLRGEDSELDKKTVENFCKKNGIPFHLYEVSELDKKPKNSIQLWARELRYHFFKQIQQKENLDFLVTAHHLNDQLETFIINLSKAAGINGLSGIPANDNHIIRPLLGFTKDEIYEFAKANTIEYREDLSNKKSDYLRNKIRLEIVPKLLETNDNFLENFKKSSSYLHQTKDFVQKQIQEIEKKLTISDKDFIILSKKSLHLESDFVQFEILKKYGFNQEEEISKIFTATNGSRFLSKDYQLIINYDELVFHQKTKNKEYAFSNKKEEEILLIEDFDCSETQIIINIKQNIEAIHKSFEWEFDAEKISFPLRLRRQQNGDEFHPTGFSGKKKVSKFFRDEKIAILARQKIWILTDNNDAILGVVPLRQDRKYARHENTSKILKIFNEK